MQQMAHIRQSLTVQQAVEATQYVPDESLDARLSLLSN